MRNAIESLVERLAFWRAARKVADSNELLNMNGITEVKLQINDPLRAFSNSADTGR